jgi:hypothetical protein
MTIAFVLGNGLSRQTVDLSVLSTAGKTYGCNAISRSFAPTVLVSTDSPISQAIQESGYSANHTHYTRRPVPGLGAQRIPQKYYGYSSGPIAAGLAGQEGNTVIYLLGFDLGPDTVGKFNNVYADTEFYKKSSAPPTYTGNWINQLIAVMKEYSTVQFYRVFGNTTAQVPAFDSVSNLKSITMQDFLDRINNTKEL